MGWLKKMFGKIEGAPPADMIFVEVTAPGGMGGVGVPVQPDEAYIELYLESLRLEWARKFATEFNGVVYSFAELSREGDSRSRFAGMSKPNELVKLGAKDLGRVITLSKQMMGPVPWRGGVLSLELGLFSVKAGNLLTPVLDYVTAVSSAAGISFVGAVKPFLPLITQGMDLIAGQTQDAALEVGVDEDIEFARGGVYAIIAAPRDSIRAEELSVDPQDRKLLKNGRPIDRAYCVFSLRTTKQKADYGEIPELKEKFAAVVAAVRENKMQEAKDALVAFRLAAITSPDLISSDARRLVEKVEQKVKEAFPAGGVAQRKTAEPISELLSMVSLYG